MRIDGQCHCGNIAFVLDWPDDVADIPARACGCSFCIKHGGVWTANPRARLGVSVRDAARMATYEFGTHTATFHVCAACGVVPFVTSRIEERVYAVVNINTFEGVDPERLRRTTADFDGEDTQSRLARRARNWIADVRIDVMAS